MTIALAALDPLDGLEVRRAPVAGVVWHRGALHRLEAGAVVWSRTVHAEPKLTAWGRRLYVVTDDVLACLDVRSGAGVWAEALPAPVRALAAHRGGVDVVAGAALLSFAPDGTPGETAGFDLPCGRMVVAGDTRYVGGDAGVWRLGANRKPALLSNRPCAGLFDRDGAVQAIVGGEGGTFLVEDDGLPLVWSFPDLPRHVVAPYGRAEWAVAPVAGRGGVWVVDRRMQARWHVPLPGSAVALAVVGTAVAVLVDDGGRALALTHPDVSSPLLLAAEGASGLHADGRHLYVTQDGLTRVYRLSEP